MTTPAFHLAETNIARLRAPLDDPSLAPFVAALERVNALADASPGFAWRLAGEGGDATDVRAFDDPDMLINMSVWGSLEALAAFVYRMALWWVAAGHRPTTAEGAERLERLRRLGAGPGAFIFRQPFPAPGKEDTAPILDRCA